MIELLYVCHLKVSQLCEEEYGNSHCLLHLLKLKDVMMVWCQPRANELILSLRGAKERRGRRGGEEKSRGVRRGRRQRESEVENGGVGAAIMMEEQDCGNIADQFCQPLDCRSSSY